MKFKYIKYIFIILVILIVIFAIYKVTSKNNSKLSNDFSESIETVYQDNLRLGICSFDTINPLLTKNKEMVNINQLIYFLLQLLFFV